MKSLTLNRNNTMLFAYALNLADLLFTNILVILFGISIESNIIGVWLYNNGLTDFFKIVFVGVTMYYLYRTAPIYIHRLIRNVYLCLFCYHIIIWAVITVIFLKSIGG